MKIKTSDLTLLALNNAVHELVYPDEPIKEGCTAPPYSTDWAFGGPIIGREKIRLNCGDGTWGVAEGVWEAAHPRNIYVSFGPTPLVAAMRCYVASEPEELQ